MNKKEEFMQESKKMYLWRPIKRMGLCGFLLLATLSAYGQSVPYRAATKKDLIGVWKQVAVRSRSLDLSDSWYSGVQYYEFFEDDYLKHIILSGKLPVMDEATKTTWRIAPKSTQYQFLNDNGLIQVSLLGGQKYLILCTYYSKGMVLLNSEANSEKIPKQGDVLLSYMNPKTKKLLFIRLLRRTKL